MTLADILIVSGIAVAVVSIIIRQIKKRRSGEIGCGCSGGCSGCSKNCAFRDTENK